MKSLWYLMAFCTLLVTWGDEAIGSNILHISVTPCTSHYLWDMIIAKALWRKGHNITFVTPINIDKNMENFTIIHTEGMEQPMFDIYKDVEQSMVHRIVSLFTMCQTLVDLCEACLKSKGIRKLAALAENNINYDLIMFDVASGQCLYPFIQKFKSPPAIGTASFGVLQIHQVMFGNDMNTAFVPNQVLPYSNDMTFFERLANHLFSTGMLIGFNLVYLSKQSKIARKYFGNDIVPLDVVFRNFSLLLANFDPIFNYPTTLAPGIIPVGGLSIWQEKTISQDLLQYLDNAKDGVILFALGTLASPDKMNKNKLNALIKAFSQLKQIVLWKFNGNIHNLSENVIIRSWLPQNDILAHPNVKLFITHCGFISTQEAIYHAVPMIGIPFNGDNESVMKVVLFRKIGVQLDYVKITTEKVLNSIYEVLNNSIYKRNIEKLSRVYKEQPEDALTRALYWVEYVIRNGAAPHHRTSARDMTYVQIFCLDIWAFIIALNLALYFVIRKLKYLILFYCKSIKICKLKRQ